MNLLIIGQHGQVARELAAVAWPESIRVTQLGRATFDLARPAQFRTILEGGPWDLIVNAGAYTAVDRAESEPGEAFAINRDGPAALAGWCSENRVPLIHLSTDYVFDGTNHRPYVESDPVRPINVYGQSKAEGESAVRAALVTHVILRTSWVYSAHGRNFVKSMLRLAAERDELRIVRDQTGLPTAAPEIARAIAAMVRRIAAGEPIDWGTYHFTGAGETTWYGFASYLLETSKAFGGRCPRITPISTREFPTPAARPLNSRLECSKWRYSFDQELRPWRESCREIVRTLMHEAETPEAVTPENGTPETGTPETKPRMTS